jgi:hypothetical protein
MTRDQKYELVGGLAGAALAYSGVVIASLAGWFQLGVLSLVVTVPAGVVFGWLVAKILAAATKVLQE